MTIEKGKPWGSSCVVSPSRVVISTDSELAQRTSDELISLNGGDIWRSLGSPQIPEVNTAATRVNIDAIQVVVDHQQLHHASSSVEIGSFLGRGRYLCIANASFVGPRNIAPRAHPNDGSLDYLEIDSSISWRQRLIASRRSLTGTHIPHPDISTRRVRDIEIERARPTEKLRIDGVVLKNWKSIRVHIVPDHWQVLL